MNLGEENLFLDKCVFRPWDKSIFIYCTIYKFAIFFNVEKTTKSSGLAL